MGEELSVLNNISAASMWNLVFGTSAYRNKFQSAADLLLVVRLPDSIAHIQHEPILPIHPQEFFRPLAAFSPPTQMELIQEVVTEVANSEGNYRLTLKVDMNMPTNTPPAATPLYQSHETNDSINEPVADAVGMEVVVDEGGDVWNGVQDVVEGVVEHAIRSSLLLTLVQWMRRAQ
jgi:hypothetical protein